MLDALVVSGAGPYVDPWHDFAATSARLAALLRDSDLTVDVTTEVEEALADPRVARLLVVNIGNPAGPRPRRRWTVPLPDWRGISPMAAAARDPLELDVTDRYASVAGDPRRPVGSRPQHAPTA